MGSFLTFALDESNALIHVDNVAKGNSCKCHCPHCGAPLCAKNAGQWREHHFAHIFGHECEGAYESQLHLLAKEVLQEAGQIMLPLSGNDSFPSGLVRLHNIEVEKWDEHFGFRPDVEGLMDNGERLLIEFLVSHKVDGKKRQTIIGNHLKCIEIDINFQALDRVELKSFLTGSDEDRKWVVPIPPPPKKRSDTISYSYGRNPLYEEVRDMLKEIFDSRTLIIHPFQNSMTRQNQPFDLRKYGYDVCEVNTKYRGFKSDLLLYRSQKEKKEYLSLNIRGRQRNLGHKRPNGLRIIDIVLGYYASYELLSKQWEIGDLASSFNTKVYYIGFKQE